MDTPTPEEVQCDDALRLLSRSLDGDLTRAETRQLYLHLASHLDEPPVVVVRVLREQRRATLVIGQ
jgi:hypothetical protein